MQLVNVWNTLGRVFRPGVPSLNLYVRNLTAAFVRSVLLQLLEKPPRTWCNSQHLLQRMPLAGQDVQAVERFPCKGARLVAPLDGVLLQAKVASDAPKSSVNVSPLPTVKLDP